MPIFSPKDYADYVETYLGTYLQYKRKRRFEAFYNIIGTDYDGKILNKSDVLSFSAVDSDVLSDLSAGEIGFYENNIPVKSGDISAVDTIYIPFSAASFEMDATETGTDVTAVNLETCSLFHLAIADNASIDFACAVHETKVIARCTAKAIEVYKQTDIAKGWRLTDLVWSGSAIAMVGDARSWDITVSGLFMDGVRAINLKGVRLEKAELGIKALDRTSFQFGYREGSVRFLMKKACVFIEKGDWIFENTLGARVGTNGENPPTVLPTVLPTGATPRWEVEDMHLLGDRIGSNKKNQLQLILAQLRTNL